MTTITSIPKGSQIAPGTERVYHQSNLIGDWKGSWQKNGRPVELKVINIRGDTAEVEYTHDGRTERGTGSVDGATISYGNISIGTKNGSVAALEFSSGTAKLSAVLNKQAADTDQSKLVGTWTGVSKTNGQSAFFQVVSVDGRDAQVRFAANGGTLQTGDGIVLNNSVMFGKASFASSDGQNGNVVIQVGRNSYSIPVAKSKPATSSTSTSTSSSSVNKLA